MLLPSLSMSQLLEILRWSALSLTSNVLLINGGLMIVALGLT